MRYGICGIGRINKKRIERYKAIKKRCKRSMMRGCIVRELINGERSKGNCMCKKSI